MTSIPPMDPAHPHIATRTPSSYGSVPRFEFELRAPTDGSCVGGGWVVAPSASAAIRFIESSLAGLNDVVLLR